MTAPTFLAAHAAAPQWRRALDVCLARLEHGARNAGRLLGDYTLGWCYFTDAYTAAAEPLLAELQRRVPGASWVGTAGSGVAASGVEYIDQPALVLMLAPLPRSAFRVFSGRQPLHPERDGFPAHAALVHADGNTPDLQELLPELAARTASGYLFGGLSSASRHLQLADAVLSGGLSGVAFSDEVGLISRVTQGCQPIGPLRTATRVDDNVLLTLDGLPALACVLQDLGLANDIPVAEMADALSGTLVGLRAPGEAQPGAPGRFGADTVVRHIVGVDPRARVLVVADEVAAGSRLAFCHRNPDAAMADLHRIAGEIRDELTTRGQRAAGAVYASCIGRGGPHFGRPNAELAAIREVLGDMPLAGFFAGGEIARDRLYGYTGVLTVFTMPA